MKEMKLAARKKLHLLLTVLTEYQVPHPIQLLTPLEEMGLLTGEQCLALRVKYMEAYGGVLTEFERRNISLNDLRRACQRWQTTRAFDELFPPGEDDDETNL